MKILVAMDSSLYADEILKQLAARPWPSHTHFNIVTVVEPAKSWEIEQTYLHQCRLILGQRLDSLRSKMPDVEITGQVHEGSAANVIVRCADEFGADLLVLGSHGDTGKRKPMIGSVAAAVVNDANCSVEIIKLHDTNSRKPEKHTMTGAHN